MTSRICAQEIKEKCSLYTANLLFTYCYLNANLKNFNSISNNEELNNFRYKNIYKFDIDYEKNSIRKVWLCKEYKKVKKI